MPKNIEPVHQRVVFTDATLGYQDNAVLNHVDLTLAAGELIGVVGCSGAGKSTILSALCGVEVVLSGTVAINGVNLVASKHTAGFVPQLTNDIVSCLSILEVVSLGNPRRGLRTSRSERQNATDLLTRLGLGDLLFRRVDELSGGQRQRVAIARALTVSSSLLVCDEPTSGADPVLSADIVNVLADVAASGTTVIVATHDFGTVVPLLHRLVGVGNGRILYDGSPKAFGTVQQTLVFGQKVSSGEFR